MTYRSWSGYAKKVDDKKKRCEEEGQEYISSEESIYEDDSENSRYSSNEDDEEYYSGSDGGSESNEYASDSQPLTPAIERADEQESFTRRPRNSGYSATSSSPVKSHDGSNSAVIKPAEPWNLQFANTGVASAQIKGNVKTSNQVLSPHSEQRSRHNSNHFAEDDKFLKSIISSTQSRASSSHAQKGTNKLGYLSPEALLSEGSDSDVSADGGPSRPKTSANKKKPSLKVHNYNISNNLVINNHFHIYPDASDNRSSFTVQRSQGNSRNTSSNVSQFELAPNSTSKRASYTTNRSDQ